MMGKGQHDNEEPSSPNGTVFVPAREKTSDPVLLARGLDAKGTVFVPAREKTSVLDKPPRVHLGPVMPSPERSEQTPEFNTPSQPNVSEQAARSKRVTQSPSQHMLQPDQVLDETYRIISLLGEGANGEVYLAEHTKLRVPAAIKLLRWTAGMKDLARRRFQREARAIALISHPNVVKLFSIGTVPEGDYMAMEYVDGPSLDRWQASLSPELPELRSVHSIMRNIFDGLQAAHEQNIIHRDLKPANIMLKVTGSHGLQAKLTDFGLAHLEHPGDENAERLTQEHMIAGTPSYMSPEQCRSLDVDARADLYSAGCLLTTLLQGSPPFRGRSHMDLMAQQMYAPVKPLTRPHELEPVPDGLERLRMALLAKNPGDRPDSAQACIEALDAAFDKPTAGSETVRPGGIGERMARVKAWDASAPSHLPTRSLVDEFKQEVLPQVTVIRASTSSDGVTDTIIFGLRAASMNVNKLPFAHAVPIHRGILIVDVGSDTNRANDWLDAVDKKNVAVIVCLQAGAKAVAQFIAAGASEVVRYPIDVNKLARYIDRAWRRLRTKRP